MKTHHGALTNIKGFAIALVCAAVAHTAGAETFVVDVNPGNGFGGRTDLWNIGDAGTLYAEWDVFNSPISDNSPDIGSFGLGTASITENTGAAFLTSGGNIYNGFHHDARRNSGSYRRDPHGGCAYQDIGKRDRRQRRALDNRRFFPLSSHQIFAE